MAVLTGDEPVSAANLKAALSEAGGVVLLEPNEDRNETYTFPSDYESYSYFLVTVYSKGADYRITTAVIASVQVTNVVENSMRIHLPAWYSASTSIGKGDADREVRLSDGYFASIIGYK